MNKTTNVAGSITQPETKEQLRQQIAQYVEQQSESKQAAHQWMKRLEGVGVGVILAAFIVALYLSFAWKSIDPILIPIAWFAFVASAGPLAVIIGLHSLILKASPPVIIPGKAQKFVTGSGAVWSGLGFIVSGVALSAFWGFFAYATWTQNWVVLQPLIGFLGVVMGVGIAVSILVGMAQKIIKTH